MAKKQKHKQKLASKFLVFVPFEETSHFHDTSNVLRYSYSALVFDSLQEAKAEAEIWASPIVAKVASGTDVALREKK